MVNARRIKINRVHPIEYTMPLKRPYGTARGVTKASTSFLVRLHGTTDEGPITAVGEAQPRRKLTGDISTDAAWEFFKSATRSLVGSELSFVGIREGLDEVRRLMRDLRALAEELSQAENVDKPFRGCLLGCEVALLDLVAQSLGISITDLLGRRRDEIGITVRTLSTQNTLERFRDRVSKQAHTFPMVRVKGRGDISKDRELLQLIHQTNLASGVTKPIWMDLNEAYELGGAKSFIATIADDIKSGALPPTITLEQPISHTIGDKLPLLQSHADSLISTHESGDIRIMADESIWDIDDLNMLHEGGGCKALNIKSAKAGGILASLDLAEYALELNPNTKICIGGMVGTSDITTWALFHLGCALPQLDYITAVPPSNVEERFSEPLAALRPKTNILSSTDAIGLGSKLAYDKLIPYIKRHAWYPPNSSASSERLENTYETGHLKEFSKTQLDNHLLEREALALGLSTLRTGKVAFQATDGSGQRIAFSWTKSTASSRSSTAITSDKHSTRMILERAGVPVPQGRRFSSKDLHKAVSYADVIGYPVVLKPLRGTGGRGVVTNIQNAQDLEWAFDALKGTVYEHRDVVVEEQIHGQSGRAFVVGDKVLSMIHWPHGTLRGDGELTVGELLLQKHRLRSRNPHLMNRPIKVDEGTLHQLNRQGVTYDTVLPAGEEVIFTLNPNPQQGGETADAIDELHPSFIEASVKAMNVIPGLAFSGVDWIIPDHTRPLSDQRAAICELNAHPSQSGNEFPLYGKSSKVSRAIVRLAADRENLNVPHVSCENLNVRIVIQGTLHDVGYVEWFAERAQRFGLSGDIRSWGRRTVEALLSGPTEEVSALVSLSVDGPPRASVEWVETTHVLGRSAQDGFEVHD